MRQFDAVAATVPLQVHVPDIAGHPAAQRTSAYSVTLGPNEALYLPPLWFHFVESVSPNVGVNLWTDSLPSDIWNLLANSTTRMSANFVRSKILVSILHRDCFVIPRL